MATPLQDRDKLARKLLAAEFAEPYDDLIRTGHNEGPETIPVVAALRAILTALTHPREEIGEDGLTDHQRELGQAWKNGYADGLRASPSSPPEDANAGGNAMMPLREVLSRTAQFMDQTKAGGGLFGEADAELRAEITKHLAAESSLNRVSIADETEPRFFIDHGMIHDRLTGKHVTTDEDSPFCDGINACCALLNELAALSSTPTPIDGEDTDNAR